MSTLDLSNSHLTFDDEFNSLSVSQTGVGTTWSDIRPQWRADANSDVGFGSSSFLDSASGYNPFSVQNGQLTITAQPDHTPYGVPGSWESGLLSTEGSFSQTYGYFEIRADFPSQPGGWGAFWMLPDQQVADPNNAGRWQELDVVESYGDGKSTSYSTIHTTDAAPNANWQQNLQVTADLPNPSGDHTYGMLWGPNTISFYLDGQLVGTKATPSDMHGPMYMMADLATQSRGTNNADLAGVPISESIDYVRSYAYDPTTMGTPPTTMADAGSGSSTVSTGTPPTSGSSTTSGASTTPPASTASTPVNSTIGSGPDHLNVSISEDAYKGDAQYTVSVDGVQVGGVQTAHASHAAGQSDQLTVEGNWGTGTHDVAVTFLNDAYDGTPSTDRNLYVDGASYDGTTASGAQQTLLSAGAVHFNVDAPPATAPASGSSTTAPTSGSSAPVNTTIGSGPDHLNLSISEDAYKGDAQYTVSVDGVQIGGVQTAHASHTAGQSDQLTVNGNWGTGTHDVAVTFLNDAYDGTESTDRNLYVDGASYDGTTTGGAQQTLLSEGTVHFNVDAPASTAPASGSSTTAPTSGSSIPVDTTIGSGPDHLNLSISEDAYKGDAQYTVSVDGVQIGGVQTAHALHAAGQSDHLTVDGNWGTGSHDVAVTFLNDAYDGTESTDRNLYVDGASYDGTTAGGAQQTLLSEGTVHFNVDAPASTAVTAPASGSDTTTGSSTATDGSAAVHTTIGSGPDHLVLSISEDAYQGDAQYQVSVDGMQIGGVQTAHASHAAGQSDQITVDGNWGTGNHDVAVTFLNDAYDGTPSTDRNLYVDAATYDGATVSGAQQTLLSASTAHFNANAPASPGTAPGSTIGSGPDHLVLSISEDAYKGDAQYEVLVDGVQIGGVQTAHASHAAGQSDQLTVQGNWGTAPHDAAVVFLNDAYDGTPSTDRNLYVNGATYDGHSVSDAQQTMLSAGVHHFGI